MTSIVSSEKMKYSGPQSSVSANEESWKGFRLKNSPLKLVVFLGHGSKYSMFIESNRFVNLGMLFLFNTRCYRSSGGKQKVSICVGIICLEGYPSIELPQKAWRWALLHLPLILPCPNNPTFKSTSVRFCEILRILFE